MSKDADDFLGDADYERHPAFFTADSKIGDTLTGVVCERPRVVSLTPIGGGDPEPKLVIAVRRDDGQVFSLWVKKGQMASAIAKAAREATGEPAVREGGKLRVKFAALGEKQPGKNAPKLWEAQYKAPEASVADQADIFGGSDDAAVDEEPF